MQNIKPAFASSSHCCCCCCCFVLLLIVLPCAAVPLQRPQLERHRLAIKYLIQFGHLSSPIPTPAELRNALETFQDMASLPRTGEVDDPTLEEMRQPRCGNGDLSGTGQRRKRFVYISRWEGKMNEGELRLKWFLHNYTPDIGREEIRSTVAKAFHIWSSQVRIASMESLSLVFEEASSEAEADITILWAEGDHGDSHMFDGPGEDGSNILAHTFYPNYQMKGSLNGDIHLDDFEHWHVNGSKNGASFPHVLVHEIGHTLGLGHSKKQQAIMFPIYRKEHLDLMQLDMDDKCAINWSYMGASDLCLYIWLLSEVLPKTMATEEGTPSGPGENTDDKQLSSNMLQQELQPWEATEAAIRAQLVGRPMPKCGPGPGGRMRIQLAEMLRRRLGFPRDIARPYADIICRFFDGFRREFDLPGTRHLHRVIRPNGAHAFLAQPDDNFVALERSLEEADGRQFDAEFFDQLMALFFGKPEGLPTR